MTNESKISFPLSLCNALEETYARQNAKFSCICPCIIVTLRRRANDLPHLATQTYWIKKDVNLTVMVPENRQYSSTPRNSQMHVRGIARAVSSVWCTGHLAVPQDYRCKRSVFSDSSNNLKTNHDMAWKYVNLVNRWGFSNKDLKMQVALFEHNMVYVWLRFKHCHRGDWYYFDAANIDGNVAVFYLMTDLYMNKGGRRWFLLIMKENVKGNIFAQRDIYNKLSLIRKQTGVKAWHDAYFSNNVEKDLLFDRQTHHNNEEKWEAWDTLLEFWPEIAHKYHPYADKMDVVLLEISNKKKFDYCSYEYFPIYEDAPENMIDGNTSYESISNQSEEKLLECIKRLSPQKYALVSEKLRELIQSGDFISIEIYCFYHDYPFEIHSQIWYYDKSELKPKRKQKLKY